jgi:hypothetical protein
MKKILIIFSIITILLTISACKKSTQQTDNSKGSKDDSAIENTTQYVKEWGIIAFSKLEEVTKKPDEVKDKIYLEFGSKVNILKNKKVNDVIYYRIQTPDKNEYWAPKDNFTPKFIIINQTDVTCYLQPDQAYVSTIKLQPGDFGVFVKQIDEYINVDFKAYRKLKDSDDKKGWVGNVWIKEGYTTDLNAAKQAFYLYLAYFYEQKNDIKSAKESLQKAFEKTDNANTEISDVIKSYQDQLNNSKPQ